MMYSEEKDIIGKKAAAFIKNGDTIYLDAGSTTESVIKYLERKRGYKSSNKWIYTYRGTN